MAFLLTQLNPRQVLEELVQGLDARLVQPYYARVLAEASNLKLTMAMETEDTVTVRAVPLEAAAAA